jgi:hypothetical protein
MNGQSDNEQFARLIVALEPWLDPSGDHRWVDS